MLTYREMVNFQKTELFSIFLYTFTINVSLQEREKCLLSICFASFVANNAYIHFLAQKYGIFISAFKNIIPKNTAPTYQDVGGVIQPLVFCRCYKNFS